jgi:hypothetical protein
MSHGSLVCALLLTAFLGGASQTVGRSNVSSRLAGMQAELGAQFKLLPGESQTLNWAGKANAYE